jgi:hypothetical protein
MGLFDALFGRKKEYPPLPPDAPAASLVERHRGPIEAFAGRVKDQLELVPTEETLYVFVGKPPDAFGVAWLRGDEEKNIRSLMKEKGLSQARVQLLSDELRASYVKHGEAPRFAATIGGRNVVVTPSVELASEVERIIQEV